MSTAISFLMIAFEFFLEECKKLSLYNLVFINVLPKKSAKKMYNYED